jgi:hypothetical protein
VLIAPAMNVRMWQHPATQRNRDLLEQDGIRFVGPVEGDMACGEYGPGRMASLRDPGRDPRALAAKSRCACRPRRWSRARAAAGGAACDRDLGADA